ncbi:MAG: ribosome biogenesis GTPase Der [Alphaproteobacteria bacterium]|nr:ribosome biogenesis GTPase Der [Alphaproteobacteria bacterium]
MDHAFTIAIAGRPNVGKSTLFNRLVGKAMALVDDQPGVTRDWRVGQAVLFDLPFTLYDTAGLEEEGKKGSLNQRIVAQTETALKNCDVILLMVDGIAGILEDDREIARKLRKTGKPILLLVNKCEGNTSDDVLSDASKLGFESRVFISAKHGEGLGDLYENLQPYAPQDAAREAEEKEEETKPVHIVIAGRPNAGKSTLVNQLVGHERMLTGPEPGLTRDAIHIPHTYKGKPIRLVDTAGMRKKARIDDKLEKISVQETLRAIRLAHVVILVIDAAMPFDKQDYSIAQHVEKEGRGLVIAINKWDNVLQKTETLRMIAAKLEASLAQLAGVSFVPVSALHGKGLDALMKAVDDTYEAWNKRTSTGKLNRWFEEMLSSHPPPMVSGGRIKPRYITQVKARPPTFGMWGSRLDKLPESYLRFLTNGLRRTFDLRGVPVRWRLMKGDNPYD